MPDKFAITNLFDAVTESFEDDSVPVPNLFGWRERGRKLVVGPRIVWIPGDDKTNELGTHAAPRSPGYVATLGDRSLGTLGEYCTVYICARNSELPEVEREQYVVCRQLYDTWFRAVYHAVYGSFSISKPAWVKGSNNSERAYGVAIRVVLTLQAAIPDTPFDGVSNAESFLDDDAKAALETELLDRQETDEITQE